MILPERGAGLKLASIHPANAGATPPLPVEQAAFLVIDQDTKAVAAILDGPAITACKTAADSALAARRLSRQDSEVLLVLGAGPVARALTEAYLHIRPAISRVLLWNRSPRKVEQACTELRSQGLDAVVVDDSDKAVAEADIISSATSTTTPLIRGIRLRPGTHVDLVGGFRPDMREADDEVMRNARIFVDDRGSATVSGDILAPLESGVIDESCIEGDLFDLVPRTDLERRTDEITVYKNAGGAYLDLVISPYVLSRLE